MMVESLYDRIDKNMLQLHLHSRYIHCMVRKETESTVTVHLLIKSNINIPIL